MEPLTTALILAALGLLLMSAVVISPLSDRLGIPALLVFLVLGIAAGSEGAGGIPFDDYELGFRIGTIALVLILFDGGLNAPRGVFRHAAAPAVLLATVGVLITAAVVAAAAFAMGLPWPVACLLGAVVSSTDAAAVFSVLRSGGVRLKAWTAAVLELESGLNDPMAILLTILVAEIVVGVTTSAGQVAQTILLQFAVGIAGGVIFGYGGSAVLRRLPLPVGGLYPVATVALAFLAFGVPTLIAGSGFLSVYLAGAIVASRPMPYQAGVRRVHDALAWLAQVLMFLALGLLVFPSRLLEMVGLGIALALVLAFVARPLAVLLLLLPFRAPWREKLFVSWVGLRGAVPIVLAMFPVLHGVPQGEEIFHLVFFAVLVNSFVPGATVPWLARRFDLSETTPPPPPAQVELISLSHYGGSFVWYRIAAASAVAGMRVHELSLPEGSVLALMVRGGQLLAPRGDTLLQVGDYVCVFSSDEDRGFIDLIFGQPVGT
jgi:potassium/hydrogen antiporter